MISKVNSDIQNWGIAIEDIESIISAIKRNIKPEKIILFGSRAKGSYKKGSDIDIAIVKDKISFDQLNQIRVDLNDLLLPYKIDILDFNKISNQELKEHILRVGKVLNF